MDIIEIFDKFPTHESCLSYLEQVRWHGKPVCPYCESDNSTAMPKEQRHHCNNCNTTYSVTVRTIFHHTHLPLQKWFLGLSIILNAKKGVSARQLARRLKVHRNTAWRMSMQIRKAMCERGQRELLQGVVEMDETYIGGKPRKVMTSDGKKNTRGRGTRKIPVVGMVQRGGKVKAEVIKRRKLTFKKLASLVREHVDRKNATLITDEWRGYNSMYKLLPHRTINHSVWYANGDIHTNSVESFWALLKRGIVGQFHKVSIRHLAKYIDEFTYRHNNRDNKNVFFDTLERGVMTA